MEKEYVDIVDENNNIIGKVTRKEADIKVLRLRASRVFVFNSRGEFLIHKRASTRLRYPDYWDFGVAETLISGESYESGAIRGLMEELNITGISNFDIKFLFKFKFTDERTRRWYKVYSLIYNGKVKVGSEVSEIKFVSEEVLNKMIKTEKFPPAALEAYKKYKK